MENNIKITTSHGIVSLLHFPSSKPTDKKLLCIHGYCCDARIFAYLGKELSKQGFDVYSIDLFGHGQSDGSKGDLDFDKTIVAINEVIAHIRGESRVYLLAHSLGCTYALWYARTYRNSIDGLILMAMYVQIKGIRRAGYALPNFSKFLQLYIIRQIAPYRRVSATQIVQSPVLRSKEVQHMIADSQVNYHYSYRYIIDVLANKNKDTENLANLDIPILILHGRNDRNVFPRVSEEFYKLLKSRYKSIQLFDCDHWFYHSVFYAQDNDRYSEQERMKVIDAICSWLKGE